MPPILTFTSDFGADSHYVAQMKAAALRLAPEVTIVDVTHSIPPQDIAQGAVVLEDCLPHFSPGSVHVAVVDPGVGSERAVIAADLDGRVVVAPDNGLISQAAARLPLRRAVRVEYQPAFGPPPCSTFHGRDIMAPAAALVCTGVSLDELGPPHSPLLLAPSRAAGSAGRVTGEIVLIDAFGNLITNVFRDQLPAEPLEIRCLSQQISGLQVTYSRQPQGTLLALIGSSNRLEISVAGGSAAARLGARVGDPVVVAASTPP